MTSETSLQQGLKDLLNRGDLPPGLIIAWGHAHFSELIEAADSGLQQFAQGLSAWLDGDYATAAAAWRVCQSLGLSSLALEDLIHLAESAIDPIVSVYVDGSFSPRDRTGGAACVYQLRDYIGMLARHLPGPLPDNNYAEAEALRLALTATELAEYSLVIYTDSETLVRALQNPSDVSLSRTTAKLVSEIIQLCVSRDVTVQFLRSRTGHLLHDRADKLSQWVRLLGEWPEF